MGKGSFPGGSVVKKLPASAGDAGSVPGPGRPHMLWSSSVHAPQLMTLPSATREAATISPYNSEDPARPNINFKKCLSWEKIKS